MYGGIMSITDSIKNKYHQIKDSLRSSLFSKNKSILRISEFSKKSTVKKILTFTAINMFICIPYFIWFGSIGKLNLWLTMIIPSFAFVFLLSNSLFFGAIKFFSFLFRKRNKAKEEVPLIINWNEPQKDTVAPEYFGKNFIGRIKEILMATGSVATTFIPFILLTNVMLVMYYLNQQTYFGIDSHFFSNIYNYLRIDSMLMVLFTTLTTTSIYGVKFVLFMKRVLSKALSAQKNTTSAVVDNTPAYAPKRALPIEEFVPSLSKEFRKNHNINASEELRANADIKKD